MTVGSHPVMGYIRQQSSFVYQLTPPGWPSFNRLNSKSLHWIHWDLIALVLCMIAVYANCSLCRLRYWPFVRGIHRSRWFPHTRASDAELWCFLLICVWINGWVNNRKAGDLRRHRRHYDVTVMKDTNGSITLRSTSEWIMILFAMAS